MEFPTPLIPAILVERYKRFLADVRLEDGAVITVHCPNPGAMLGLTAPGNPVWISDSGNPKRKLRHTLELMQVQGPAGPAMVGINTMRPNALAEEAIRAGRIAGLSGYSTIRREVRYGTNSRIDLLLSGENRRDCYVEVKNVHLMRRPRLHEFPDCKTERGVKHLFELANMVREGHRAVMLFLVQRADGDRLSIAADMDPDYAEAFRTARDAGVEALALGCDVSTRAIVARQPIDLS